LLSWIKASFLSIALMCTKGNVHAQDTISIYFSLGSSRIDQFQQEALKSIPTNYNIVELDSIQFIGMADSLGRRDANFRLSRKRANNVRRKCSGWISKSVPTALIAKGEQERNAEERNRAVHIVLFNNAPAANVTLQVDSIGTDSLVTCYKTDYHLLHACHVRNITKGRKNLTLLETHKEFLPETKLHYYGLLDEDGAMYAKRLKWSKKTTGLLWWKKQRYQAYIPTPAFEDYKVLTLGNAPCDSCSFDVVNSTPAQFETELLFVDHFLMNNMHYRTSLFRNNKIKIRVPRMYVDLGKPYFTKKNAPKLVVWKTKRGKRRKLYYYYKLKVGQHRSENIYRSMATCINDTSDRWGSNTILCGTKGDYSPTFTVEAAGGLAYQNQIFFPYFGSKLKATKKEHELTLLLAYGFKDRLLGRLTYNYIFSTKYLRMTNPLHPWKEADEIAPYPAAVQLYLGTSFNYLTPFSPEEYLVQNVHVGILFRNHYASEKALQFYIECGPGYNFTSDEADIQLIGELGFRYRLIKSKL